VFEGFHTVGGALRPGLDAAVITVSNVPGNLMSGSGALSKEAITDSLHIATDQEFSCNLHHFYCALIDLNKAFKPRDPELSSAQRSKLQESTIKHQFRRSL
jgi:hypothetical protein